MCILVCLPSRRSVELEFHSLELIFACTLYCVHPLVLGLQWKMVIRQGLSHARRSGRAGVVVKAATVSPAQPCRESAAPLILVMQAGFVSAARDGQLDAVREAIAAGIAVDRKDSTGYAALFWAVAKGHDAIVSELLRAGASVHTSCHGMPVTWRAATDSTVVILKMLLAAGGSVNGARKDGMTPLISLARSVTGAKRGGVPVIACHRPRVASFLEFCIYVYV